MKIENENENSNSLLKWVAKTIKNETKEQNRGFLSMFLGTWGASLLRNLLSRKGVVRACSGNKMDFQCRLVLQQTLKYKSIMRMNQDLLEFFKEIICLKKLRMGHT